MLLIECFSAGPDNQTENNYFLFASFPEFKKGKIVYNGLDYEVFVSNGFSKCLLLNCFTTLLLNFSESMSNQYILI